VGQREGDTVVRERDAPERFLAVRPLGGLRAQEFPARRRVEVQLLDGHRRAARERGRLDAAGRSPFDLDAPRVRPPGRARRDRGARYRGDRRERLAAEAERRNRLEVDDGDDLRRRVARERERQVLALDAGAVVGHADPLDATAGNVDVDLRRAGIERVLEQFLERRRRPLDDLARGDLVDQQVGELADRAHQRAIPRAQRA
jgi:hypothetical protein